MELNYHSREANVVSDALSGRHKGVIASLVTTKKSLLRELDALQVKVILSRDRSRLTALQLTSRLVERIKEDQTKDSELTKISKKVKE